MGASYAYVSNPTGLVTNGMCPFTLQVISDTPTTKSQEIRVVILQVDCKTHAGYY